ncbi:MAG: hypothetical protein ABI905_00035 [Betaproteobacteria bacterium]
MVPANVIVPLPGADTRDSVVYVPVPRVILGMAMEVPPLRATARKPGGVLVFATCNLGRAEATRGFRLPDMQFSANPLRLAVRLVRLSRDTVISFIQRRRNLVHDLRTPHYAIANDRCHNYGAMLYCITLASQRRQLVAAGFRADAVAYDSIG